MLAIRIETLRHADSFQPDFGDADPLLPLFIARPEQFVFAVPVRLLPQRAPHNRAGVLV
jgi:hypothetical protein